MSNESPRGERLTDRLLVPVEQLIPGMNTENLHGVRTDIELTLQGKYKEKKLPAWDMRSLETPFVDHLIRYSRNEQYQNFFKNFASQVVVDLGAGAEAYNTHDWISQFKPKGYVAVEPYNAVTFFTRLNRGGDLGKLAPIAVVQEGALEFLERIPDNSVSILTSGLDGNILEDDYALKVSKEVVRVLDPKGIFIRGSETIIKPEGLENFNDLHMTKTVIKDHDFALFVAYKKRG